MRILRGGEAIEQQLREDARNGVEPEHREGLEEFNNKLRDN